MEDVECDRGATSEESPAFQTKGSRKFRQSFTLNNLGAILAVGDRVRPLHDAQFRRWPTTVLGEYLLKGSNPGNLTLPE